MAADLPGKIHCSRQCAHAQNYVNNGSLPGKSAASVPKSLIVIVSADFGGKQSSEIWPRSSGSSLLEKEQ